MKKLLLFVFALSAFGLSINAQQKIITIKGNITNAPPNTKVMLMAGEGSVFRSVESDSIVDGKFHFEYPIDSTMVLPISMSVSSGRAFTTFWAAEGLTTIKGDVERPREWQATNNTPEQRQKNEIFKAGSKYIPAITDLINKEQAIRDIKAEGSKKDSLRKEMGLIREQINLVDDKKSIDELKCLSSQKTFTVSGLDALKTIAEFGLIHGKGMVPYKKDIQAIYDRLPEAQKQSSYGKVVHSALNPKKKLVDGDQLPLDSLIDTDGKSHTLSQYYGKHILVDIWSSGCGPCIMACDELRDMQERYKDKLTIVGISVDTEKTWKSATKAHNISWTNLSDLQGQTAGFCANFEIRGIPHYILVDPQGKIIKTYVGYGKGMFEKIFKDLFGE